MTDLVSDPRLVVDMFPSRLALVASAVCEATSTSTSASMERTFLIANQGDAPSGGSGDDVSTSPIAQGDFFLDPGDDDAAADGVDSLSDTAADAVAGAAANISMVYGGGAEENADAGAGAAEEMGFDVLDMGDDGDGWMNIQPTGVGAPSAAVGAVAGFVGSHAGVGDVGGGGQASRRGRPGKRLMRNLSFLLEQPRGIPCSVFVSTFLLSRLRFMCPVSLCLVCHLLLIVCCVFCRSRVVYLV